MKKYKELYYQSLEKNKLLETINTNLINLINKLEIKNEQIKYPIDSNQNKNLKFISLEEKKKYIRKRCEHGKYSFQCKDCKGSSFCNHGKYKIYCKEIKLLRQF